jgi:GTPase SAR1 family protein
MSSANDTTARSENLRRETISLLEIVSQKAAEFDLPEPPEALERFRQKLSDNIFKVLVVGEAKRGKSTFVNALIGRDILPTDVDVATSQVFHISPSERPAYRLRFEDDSTQEITLEELTRYGSQATVDKEGIQPLSKLLRWIEVEGPITFLPKGVRLLDTPGLGALYSAHAQITQRFVPHADAVIFVLDSGQPIVQEEINFIETILGATSSIFFIQTKIDQHGREHWQEIQRRNQEILKEHFKDRLTDTRVWPISSTNLRKAADPDNEDAETHLMVSRHKELASALRAFLFRAAGWSRAAEAVLVAGHFQTHSRQLLATRQAALVEETKQKRAELHERVTEQKQEFELEWGERGQKRQRLLGEIRNISGVAKKNFIQTLAPHGPIDFQQLELIEALTTLEAVQQRGQAISGEVIGAATEQWQRICREAQARCMERITPLLKEAAALTTIEDVSVANIAVRDRALLDFEGMLWKSAKGARTDAMVASGLVTAIGSGASYLFSIAFPPFLVVAAVAALWGAKVGWSESKQREVEMAKPKLRSHLMVVLQQVRQYFFDVDISTARLSRVDEYFDRMERNLFDQIQKLTEEKSKEAKLEARRLIELAELDGRQRTEQIETNRRQIAEWDKIGATIKGLMMQLRQLEHSHAATSSGE